LLQTDIM